MSSKNKINVSVGASQTFGVFSTSSGSAESGVKKKWINRSGVHMNPTAPSKPPGATAAGGPKPPPPVKPPSK